MNVCSIPVDLLTLLANIPWQEGTLPDALGASYFNARASVANRPSRYQILIRVIMLLCAVYILIAALAFSKPVERILARSLYYWCLWLMALLKLPLVK